MKGEVRLRPRPDMQSGGRGCRGAGSLCARSSTLSSVTSKGVGAHLPAAGDRTRWATQVLPHQSSRCLWASP